MSNESIDSKGFAVKALMLLVQAGVISKEELEEAQKESVKGIADLLDKRSTEIAIKNDYQN